MLYLLRALSVLCLFMLLSTGCGPLVAGDSLAGTYHRRGQSAPGYLKEIRFKDNKCIMVMPVVGEVAHDYTVKGGMVYVGGAEGQLTFHIDGPGVISNRGTLGLDGTYEKGAE